MIAQESLQPWSRTCAGQSDGPHAEAGCSPLNFALIHRDPDRAKGGLEADTCKVSAVKRMDKNDHQTRVCHILLRSISQNSCHANEHCRFTGKGYIHMVCRVRLSNVQLMHARSKAHCGQPTVSLLPCMSNINLRVCRFMHISRTIRFDLF